MNNFLEVNHHGYNSVHSNKFKSQRPSANYSPGESGGTAQAYVL